MKKLFGLFVFTIVLSHTGIAQDKIWQLNLSFTGKMSKEFVEDSIPAFAYSFFEPFIPGSDAYQKVSVLTSAGKIKSTVNQNQILVADRNKKQEFSYTKGDDVISQDIFPEEFPLLTAPSTKEEAYLTIEESPEIKQIATLQAKKAKIKLIEPHVGELAFWVWYSSDIPSYYIAGLPFLVHLPGAVLKLQAVDYPTIGFEVTAVQDLKNTQLFDLPQQIKVFNLNKQVETQQAEESNFFADSFPLKAPLKWFSQKNDAFGDEFLFGVKNEDGTEIYPANFYSIDVLNDDHAIVSDMNNAFWIINDQAKKINRVGFEVLYAISNENMVYAIAEKYGIINASGVSIIGGLANISSFVGNYLLFTQDDKQGLMDFNGRVLLKPTLDFLDTNEKGNIIVTDKQADGELKEYTLEEFQDKYLKSKK